MYGIIGNGETCALISEFCSLDWLCIPRFDSPTMFARALDSVNGGSITLWHGSGDAILPFEPGKQRYFEDTNVLETITPVGNDIVRTIDFMPFRRRWMWRIMGISGPDRLRLIMDFDPRPDYNRADPTIEAGDKGLIVSGPGQALFMYSPEPGKFRKKRITFNVKPPMTLPILFSYGPGIESAIMEASKAGDFGAEYQAELKLWRDYLAQASPALAVNPRMHYYYTRSLLILKLLMYEPTGAILAAPTTSFPELVGCGCNWDYRFCWVRDAAYCSEAFALAGFYDDARKVLDFLLGIMKEEGKPFPYPLVSVDGTLNGTEETLIDTLAGFGNSRPVRVGNLAALQRQNDLEGEVIHAIYTLYRHYAGINYVREVFPWISRVVDYVRDHWREKDAGIWEFRTEDMNYVHSKTMCWAALHYGGRMASDISERKKAREWAEEADKVKEDVLANGWSEKRKCFKRSYEDDSYDASVLAIPLMGMLPVHDPRVKMTVKSLTGHLGTGGLLKRFEEEQGAFMLVSLWLAQVMIKDGRHVNALEIINRAARYASSSLGLFAEEYDMYFKRLVGNIPQSFSHEELIRSVQYLLGKQ